MPYQFLSDGWIDAATKIRDEVGSVAAAVPVRMNLVIVEVPFGTGSLEAHMDTTNGGLELDLGHLEGADVTATLDYETAKAMLVDNNPQVGMQAFMAGRIKLQGDMAKAMALTSSAPPDAQLTARLQEITA